MKIPESICVFRLSSLGDIVLTTVLLRRLRRQYPQAYIVMVVAEQYYEAVRFNIHCSAIVTVHTKNGLKGLLEARRKILAFTQGKKFDVVIDLHKNIRTALLKFSLGKTYYSIDKFRKQKLELVHRKIGKGQEIIHIVERYFKAVDDLHLTPDNEGAEIWTLTDFEHKEYRAFREKTTDIRIAIAPGARHFTKRYPAHKYVEALNALHQLFPKAYFELYGGNEEKELCHDIETALPFVVENYAGKLSLLESVEQLNHCSLMISNDSGLMHIAAARGIPVVAIFGSTVQEFGFIPYAVPYRIVETDADCRPCSHIGRESCPLGHFTCMNAITTEQLLDAVQQLVPLQSSQ